MTTGKKEKYREIIVPPINSWREAMWVLAALAVLVLFGGMRAWTLSGNEDKLFMQPYHRLDTTLNDSERPLYQAIRASENEIIGLWLKNRQWPSVELLDEEGIPPFAADLLPDPLADFQWTMHDRGPWVDYLGVNSGNTDMPSIIIRIINLHADFHPHPHPGIDYDPNQQAAVQVWIHPATGQRYAGMQLVEHGWFWIVSPEDPSLQAARKTIPGVTDTAQSLNKRKD